MGLEVDEHSITVARYESGLCKFETRWGTFTDPWVLQPQPKCGFVIVGREGTIASYDYEKVIRVQTREHPEAREMAVDELRRAKSYNEYRQVLKRDDIEVVDIATHPQERLCIVRAAVEAGKHVLSQKPFAIDLDEGRRLVELAKKKNVKLAVNQNGRWAPHF